MVLNSGAPLALWMTENKNISISRICLGWIETVQRMEDVILRSNIIAGSGGNRNIRGTTKTTSGCHKADADTDSTLKATDV